MDEELKKRREEAITQLQAALDELASGTELTRYVTGHGLQSRYFEFEWNDPALRIDFHLPHDCVLSDEETQRSDASEIEAALRLALLLLDAANRKALFQQGEEFLSISLDEFGTEYRIFGSSGNALDSGEDLEILVRRLELSLPVETDSQILIWS
jgi:hypothetical protein